MINWDIKGRDFDMIVKIAERVERDLPHYPDDRRTLLMDLQACHCNGCPLALDHLLVANRLDFSHDIYGIRTHLDRETGKLEDFFDPRYALSNLMVRP